MSAEVGTGAAARATEVDSAIEALDLRDRAAELWHSSGSRAGALRAP